MQQIIDLVAKLESGELKKYSELREAIAHFYLQLGRRFDFEASLSTKEGKQQLLTLAKQMISEYEANTEEVETKIDRNDKEVERSMEKYPPLITEIRAKREPFFEAILALQKDNPKIYTAEGLQQLGDECDRMINFERKKRKNTLIYPSLDWSILAKLAGGLEHEVDEAVFRRMVVAPGEFITEEVPKIEPSDNPMTQAFKTMFTRDDLLRMDVTRRIYENIRLLQDTFQIPGLTVTSFDCRGLKVEYLQEACYLNLQPRDERKLWRQVNKVTNCFLSLAAMESPKYKLSRVDFSDHDTWGDAGEDLPTTYSQVREYAKRAKAVWIYHESTQWEEKTQKIISSKHGEMEATIGHGIERPEEPDTIELHLTMAWDDFKTGSESEVVTFRLSHPYRD